jgi:endonuclease YncB( thermonuclease family)
MAWPFAACKVVIGMAMVAAWFGRLPAAIAATPACAPSPGQAVRVEYVGAAHEIGLADGRIVRLSGIDIPQWQASEVQAWLAALVGQPVLVRPLFRTADRWGRIVAQIFVANGTELLSAEGLGLSQALVAAGLARVRPDDGGTVDPLCFKALLATEAQARFQHLGVWASPDHGLQQADDTGSLLKNTGEFAVFEGRVLSVGERAERTYINFGRRWSDDTTVTIAKRYWRMMTKSGFSAEVLRGQRIRVRGVVENDNGPLVEVTDLNQIEFIEADRVR